MKKVPGQPGLLPPQIQPAIERPTRREQVRESEAEVGPGERLAHRQAAVELSPPRSEAGGRELAELGRHFTALLGRGGPGGNGDSTSPGAQPSPDLVRPGDRGLSPDPLRPADPASQAGRALPAGRRSPADAPLPTDTQLPGGLPRPANGASGRPLVTRQTRSEPRGKGLSPVVEPDASAAQWLPDLRRLLFSQGERPEVPDSAGPVAAEPREVDRLCKALLQRTVSAVRVSDASLQAGQEVRLTLRGPTFSGVEVRLSRQGGELRVQLVVEEQRDAAPRLMSELEPRIEALQSRLRTRLDEPVTVALVAAMGSGGEAAAASPAAGSRKKRAKVARSDGARAVRPPRGGNNGTSSEQC